MSAHEAMETSEHAKEAAGENRKIALLISVIALFLRFRNSRQGAQTASISDNVEASNSGPSSRPRPSASTSCTAADTASSTSTPTPDPAIKATMQKQIDSWQRPPALRSDAEPPKGRSN